MKYDCLMIVLFVAKTKDDEENKKKAPFTQKMKLKKISCGIEMKI